MRSSRSHILFDPCLTCSFSLFSSLPSAAIIILYLSAGYDSYLLTYLLYTVCTTIMTGTTTTRRAAAPAAAASGGGGDVRGGVLASFDPASAPGVRCLTRQEESLLQTAAAMVIVKERFRQRQQQRLQEQGKKKKKASRHSGHHHLEDHPFPAAVAASARRKCRLDSIFPMIGAPPGTTMPRPLWKKLLERPHRDHMDHLFQVACRLAGSVLAAGTGGDGATREDEKAAEIETSKRTLESVACHLVQQLDSWMLDLSSTCTTSTTATGSTTSEIFHNKNNNNNNSYSPIEKWMTSSFLSHPHAAWVHRAMILQAFAGVGDERRRRLGRSGGDGDQEDEDVDGATTTTTTTSRAFRLLDGWWHVTATLIAQVYHGNLSVPSSSSISCDALAVALLGLLQTIVSVSSSSSSSSSDHYDGRSFIPACLQELLLPLAAPANLSNLQWTLSTNTTTTSTTEETNSSLFPSGGYHHDHDHPPPLKTGAKLLMRLGLYRILLLQDPPESSSSPSSPPPYEAVDAYYSNDEEGGGGGGGDGWVGGIESR